MDQDPEREAQIIDFMERTGLDRAEAELAVAIERGEAEDDTPVVSE